LYLNTGRTIEAQQVRLTTTLEADAKRSRWDAVRKVLDRGAVLLAQFGDVVGSVKQLSPTQVELPAGWNETIDEVGAFRSRLRLWFDDEDEVVNASTPS
jgi:hypothetical protein